LQKLLAARANASAVFFSSTLAQARATVESPMRMIIDRYPEGFCKYNRSEHKYTFFVGKGDWRELYLLSYENQETKRGYHPEIIVLDECGSIPQNMLEMVIMPMLGPARKFGVGTLICIGTAQGPHKFYELWKRGKDKGRFPDWISYTIKADQSTLLTQDYLWTMRNGMRKVEYDQEFECDFNANVLVGSVYGEFIDRYTINNVDDSYDYDPRLPVWTAWDLGHSNKTAIWFFQFRNNVVTFIDYYENSGYDVSFYAGELAKKPYIYDTAILPWDAGINNVRAPITIAEMLEEYGIRNEVLGNTSVKAGIDAARILLKTAKFNGTKCEKGLEHLKSYRYKVDYKTGVDRQKFMHEHSDGADAFRYAAVGQNLWRKSISGVRIVQGRDYSIF
jgi:hypothetical protein